MRTKKQLENGKHLYRYGSKWTEYEVWQLDSPISDDHLSNFLGRTVRAVQQKRYKIKKINGK